MTLRDGRTALLLLCVASAVRVQAQRPADTAGIGAALQHFTALTGRMANDSLGALYLPDGVLAAPDRAPIVGPAAVTAFLATFSNYHVLAYATRADSARVRGDTVEQLARWWQRVRVPAGDTVSVSGGLRTEWVRVGPGLWRIRRIETFPMDAGPPPRPQD
jgi:ketosteroid isomerase-like protein